jgi:hypothetical protein
MAMLSVLVLLTVPAAPPPSVFADPPVVSDEPAHATRDSDIATATAADKNFFFIFFTSHMCLIDKKSITASEAISQSPFPKPLFPKQKHYTKITFFPFDFCVISTLFYFSITISIDCV